VLGMDKTVNRNLNDNEIVNNSFDDSILPTTDNDSLHYYTDVTTEEFCSELSRLLKDSHTCKSHCDRLLNLIQSQ
jgi:hypothetical protein